MTTVNNRIQPGRRGSRGGARVLTAMLLATVSVNGCERAATSPAAPATYLAIVAKVAAPEGVSLGNRFSYRVSELSGTVGVDTTIVVAPRDTVLMSVPPATYRVDLDLPAFCDERRGTARHIVVTPSAMTGVSGKTLTSIVRYHVTCRPSLTITTTTEGPGEPDSDLIYHVVRTDEGDTLTRTGMIAPTDTVMLDEMPAGEYRVRLMHVSQYCVVTNNGGRSRHVFVDGSGGTAVWFRVTCADPAARPQVVDFQSSYRRGISGVYVRAADPDRDIERLEWDITDCNRNSVLPAGGKLWRGLSWGRTARQDSVTLVLAFDVGLSDEDMAGKCTSLRVEDEMGNSSPIIEERIGGERGSPPEVTRFNAIIIGDTTVQTTLEVVDAEGDFVGTFAAAKLRDGVIGPPNGEFDIGYFNRAGYLSTDLPSISLTGRLRFGDVRTVIVYVVDRSGNVTRMEDVSLRW